jgi:hypothetical protein
MLAQQVIEQERRRLGRHLEEISRLCESDAPPAVFYGELLKRLLEALAAPAGGLWTRTAQGNLQLQFQANLREIGLDRTPEAAQSHSELLRMAVAQPKARDFPPHSSYGAPQNGHAVAGNPTDHILLLAPIMLGEEVGGFIEVFQQAHRPAAAVPGFLQFIGLMAELAARYQRHHMLGQMTGQQTLWTQLEAFSRQIHGSLNPVEVSYLIANEGRRLIECDRVSIAVRYGRHAAIEAVSGADVVEKRSNLVRLMRRLCDRVLAWGEKLAFTGIKDDSLPPLVLEALDAYLAESPSKLLVVQPLKDEREAKSKGPPRAAMIVECFETPADAQQPLARLEIVAKHATSALYNAVEHRRIPMRFLWMPIAKAQEGVGGPTSAIVLACCVALATLIAVLVFVPYPLKMEATGKLVPEAREYVYTPGDVTLVSFLVGPNEKVLAGRGLVEMEDHGQLGAKMLEYDAKLASLSKEMATLESQGKDPNLKSTERLALHGQFETKKTDYESTRGLLDRLIKRTNADRKPGQVGKFTLTAPEFTGEQALALSRRPEYRKEWTVLSSSFKEELTNKTVRPSDPILSLGATDGPWEIELKIPQKHYGQILKAFNEKQKQGQKPELEVQFLLRTDPTQTFKGYLHRDRVAPEAQSDKENKDDQEPVVLAYVRIDNEAGTGPGDPGYIAEEFPRHMLLSGVEVHAKVVCGNQRMGYSLFYGVWEFLHERVLFYF